MPWMRKADYSAKEPIDFMLSLLPIRCNLLLCPQRSFYVRDAAKPEGLSPRRVRELASLPKGNAPLLPPSRGPGGLHLIARWGWIHLEGKPQGVGEDDRSQWNAKLSQHIFSFFKQNERTGKTKQVKRSQVSIRSLNLPLSSPVSETRAPSRAHQLLTSC